MKIKKTIFYILPFLLLGCGSSVSGTSSSSATGAVSLSIPAAVQVRGLVVIIQSVRLKVEDEGGNVLINKIFGALAPDGDDIITLDVEVPIGPNRHFYIDAFGPLPKEGFRGDQIADVEEADTEVAIDTHYLNFCHDAIADEFVEDPSLTQPDITEVHVVAENVIESEVSLQIFFNQPIDPSTITGFIGFDSDRDPTSGGVDVWGDLLNQHGQGLIADDLGVERYIAITPGSGNALLTPLFTLHNAENSPPTLISPATSEVTSFISADHLSLKINIDEAFARTFMGNRGTLNVLIGRNFPNASPAILSNDFYTDVALEFGIIEYDLNLLFQ